MDKLISLAQSAIIPCRTIMDNILLSNGLIRDFHLQKWVLIMCLYLDLYKAFDSVLWYFVESSLISLNFPLNTIRWIIECSKSSSFSILTNYKACGFFNSIRGLR